MAVGITIAVPVVVSAIGSVTVTVVVSMTVIVTVFAIVHVAGAAIVSAIVPVALVVVAMLCQAWSEWTFDSDCSECHNSLVGDWV